VAIGRDIERVHYGYEFAIMMITTFGAVLYNTLVMDDPSKPTNIRYGNVSWAMSLQIIWIVSWYTWCVKGKLKLQIVSVRRVWLSSLVSFGAFMGGVQAVMLTLNAYPSWLRYYEANVTNSIAGKFVFDLVYLGSVTAIWIPVIFKVGAFGLFGPLNPALRQDRLRLDGVFQTEQMCSWTGTMVYNQYY